MARGLIALMMVLLVGNPLCCCVFGHGVTAQEETLPSCCRAKLDAASSTSDRGPASSEEAPLSCLCRKGAGVIAHDEVLRPAARLIAPLPVFAFYGTELLPPATRYSRGQLLHPGRFGPVVTEPPLHVLFEVYRC